MKTRFFMSFVQGGPEDKEFRDLFSTNRKGIERVSPFKP